MSYLVVAEGPGALVQAEYAQRRDAWRSAKRQALRPYVDCIQIRGDGRLLWRAERGSPDWNKLTLST